MPCYQPSDEQMAHSRGYDEGRRAGGTFTAEYHQLEHLKTELSKLLPLKDENKKLTAMLCAVINELKERGIDHDVITQASRSGLVDIMSFWKQHSKEDEVRVAEMLHKNFSEHEQEIVKKLLNKK